MPKFTIEYTAADLRGQLATGSVTLEAISGPVAAEMVVSWLKLRHLQPVEVSAI